MPTYRGYASKYFFASIVRNSFIFIFGIRSRGSILCEGALWFQKQVLWRWQHQDAWVSGRQQLHCFCGNGFLVDSRYSNGNKLHPSSSRHISLLVLNRIYTFFAPNEGRVCISVQFHIQVYLWCIIRKPSKVWVIPEPDIYPNELGIKDTTKSNTASYLDLLLSIEREVQLYTSIYDTRDDLHFHINNSPSVSEKQYSILDRLWSFISQQIRYARACASYGFFNLRATRLSNKLLEQWYVKKR